MPGGASGAIGEVVQATLEIIAADVVQELGKCVVRGALLGTKRLDESEHGGPLGATAFGRVALEPVDLHVEVSTLAKRVGKPLDLRESAPERRTREAGFEDLERGTQPARRDARVVERLDVVECEHVVLAREDLFGTHGDGLRRHRGV